VVLRRPAVRVQAAGTVAFGGVAALSVAVEPTLAVWLVATGWLAHAAWDFAHFRAARVVACAVAGPCRLDAGPTCQLHIPEDR
jgi:hypothetical protein